MNTVIDRSTFRELKSMSKDQLTEFLCNFYNNAQRDLINDLNTDELRSRLKSIKGIGDSRAEEILKILQEMITIPE